MKKLMFIFLVAVSLYSCDGSTMSDAVVVERINILDGQSHKYQVQLRTDPGSDCVYYNTNHRFQVGDTLVSYYEFFEGKNQDVKNVTKERDSLRKELDLTKYYLDILKERVIFDTLKRK